MASKTPSVELLTERKCRGCGIDISHMRSNAVNCSRACKGRAVSRKAAKLGRESGALLPSGLPPINCSHCDTIVNNPSPGQRFCDLACSDAERYIRQRPKRQAAARDLYWRTLDRQLANSRRWRRANPDKRHAAEAARRARKFNNPGYRFVSADEWAKELRRIGCCTYCGATDVPLEMDHVIPLSRGGRHAIGNLTPACATCNRSKNDLLLSEWRFGRQPSVRRR